MTFSAGDTIGAYEIVGALGAGGMGEVYRARDVRLGRQVALKVLRSDTVSDHDAHVRLRREAEAVSALNHPGICTLHDVIEDRGQLVLVMEMIEGRPLSELIPAHGLPIEATVRYGVELANALAHAHQQCVVHRDLKPANIIVTAEGHAKVLDFGVSRQMLSSDAGDKSLAQTTMSEAGTIAGTLPYLAPEVLAGRPADIQSDVWALGVVLFEMATGRRPFIGPTPYALTAAILHEPMAALPAHVPAAVRTVIQRCLDREPSHRYQSAREIAAALETIRPEAPSFDADASHRVARWRLAAGAAILAASLLVAGYFTLGRRGTLTSSGPATIAVLPFQMMLADDQLRFLGVGIPDAIISRLSKIKQVIPRPTTSTIQYENRAPDATDVGRRLASQFVLTGNLQQSLDRLRVSVQLIRTSDGVPIWSEHYDNLTHANLLDLEDVISERIADALRIRLTAGERERLYRRYTENVKAYEMYLLGRSLVARSNSDAMRAAVDAFEGALRLDGNYVVARAGVAVASAYMRFRFAPETETAAWGERATREAKAALAHDPQLAEAHEALAAVYRSFETDWDSTIEESRVALELNANLDQPHYFRATAFYHLGLFDLAEREVQMGIEINPGGRADPMRQRAISALYTGRFNEASEQFLEVQRVTQSHAFDYFLAQAQYYDGQRQSAERTLEPLQANTPGDRRGQAVLASYFAARRDARNADRLIARLTQSGFMDHHMAYAIGEALGSLGRTDKAIDWLNKAITTGFRCYPWYERDPMLEPLRANPEFQRLLETLRRSWEAARGQYKSAGVL